jgi:hypothetical protein
MRIIGRVFFVAGGLLLTLVIIGHFTALGNYKSAPPRAGERFDYQLAQNIRSWPALQAEAERRVAGSRGGGREIMMALYGLVTERFTHGDADHTVFSNWLLWGLRQIHPAFAHIRQPETMVQRGYSLLCDQSSYVLLQLALEQGIRARHVGLDGHVVMEAWYDDDWHLFDPDLEVVPQNENGRVLSVEELVHSPGLLDHYYGKYKSENVPVVAILGSRENNTFMTYPQGAWFEWKSNVLFWLEKVAERLKFIIPAILLLVGAGMMWRGRRHDPVGETS